MRGARNQFVPDHQFAQRPRLVEFRTTRELVGQRIGFLTKEIYETLDGILREHGEVIRFRRAPTPEEKAIMEDAEKNFFYKHSYYRWMLKQPFRVLSGPWPFFDDLFLEQEKKSEWFNSAWFDDIRFQGKEFAHIGSYKKDDLLVLHRQSAPKFRRDINRIVQLWRVNPKVGKRMEAIAKGEIIEPDEYWWFPEWIKYRTKRLKKGLIDLDEGLHRGEQTIFMFEELEEDDYVRLQLYIDRGKLDNNPDYFIQCERTHLRYYITPTSLATRRMWVIRPGDDGTQERFLPRPDAMKHNVYVHHMNDEKWKAEHGYLSEEELKSFEAKKRENEDSPEYEELSQEELLETVKDLGAIRDAARERFEKIIRGEIVLDPITNKKGKTFYIERVNGEDFREAKKRTEESLCYYDENGKKINPRLPNWWFLPRKERMLELMRQGKEEVQNWDKNKNDYQILAPNKQGEWKVVVDGVREFSEPLWQLLWYMMEDWGDWRYRDTMTMEQFKSRTNWYDWDENNDRGPEDEVLEPDSWKRLQGKDKEKRWKRFNSIQLMMGIAKREVATHEFQLRRLKVSYEFTAELVNNKLRLEQKDRLALIARYEDQGFYWDGKKLLPAIGWNWKPLSSFKGVVSEKLREVGILNYLPCRNFPYSVIKAEYETNLNEYQKDFFRNTSLKPLSYCEFSLNGRGRDNLTRAEQAVKYLYNGMWRQLSQKYGIKYLEVVPTYRNIEKIISSEKQILQNKIKIIEETRQWLKDNDPEFYKTIEKKNKGKWTLPVILDENEKDKIMADEDWALMMKEGIKHLNSNPQYPNKGAEINYLATKYNREVINRRNKLRQIYDKAVAQGIIEPDPDILEEEK